MALVHLGASQPVITALQLLSPPQAPYAPVGLPGTVCSCMALFQTVSVLPREPLPLQLGRLPCRGLHSIIFIPQCLVLNSITVLK